MLRSPVIQRRNDALGDLRGRLPAGCPNGAALGDPKRVRVGVVPFELIHGLTSPVAAIELQKARIVDPRQRTGRPIGPHLGRSGLGALEPGTHHGVQMNSSELNPEPLGLLLTDL